MRATGTRTLLRPHQMDRNSLKTGLLPSGNRVTLLRPLLTFLIPVALACGSPGPAPPPTGAPPTPTVSAGLTEVTSPSPDPTATFVPSPTALPTPPSPTPPILATSNEIASDCPVTLPVPPETIPKKAADPILGGSSRPDASQLTMYGNDSIWVTVPGDGVTTGASAQGGGIFEKFISVDLIAGGTLVAEARRLDGDSRPAEIEVSSAWTSGGSLYVVAVLFPTTGCWEITERAAARELRFAVWVSGPQDRTLPRPLLTISESGVSWTGPAGEGVALDRNTIDAALPAEFRGRPFEIGPSLVRHDCGRTVRVGRDLAEPESPRDRYLRRCAGRHICGSTPSLLHIQQPHGSPQSR